MIVLGFLSEKHKMIENTNSIEPCIMSPNMTPNRNGKVTIVKIAGLTSLYMGIP